MRGMMLGAALALLFAGPARAQTVDERPASFKVVTADWNYSRASYDIAMRDGVKLHVVVLVPKGAKDAPILLTRTPYDAESMANYAASGHMDAAIDGYDNADDVIVAGGYIRVFADVRGEHGSEGVYMMNPPLAHTKYNPTATDDSTDTYDTIDWLVKNTPQSNGKVGVLGISYDGFLPLMATIDPHPALKVSVPMNPMVDGWRGDDWFHNGAFRQMNIDYVWEQEATKDGSSKFWWNEYDIYDAFLRAGSAGEIGRRHGMEQVGFWRKLTEHPAYDDYWSSQAMDKVLAARPIQVPMMIVSSLWDQEDIYGGPAVYAALKDKPDAAGKLFLSLGPWYHGQEIGAASNLGAVKWDQDTAKWWRWHVLAPFLSHYLKGTPMDVAPVTVFRTGTNEWQRRETWPEAAPDAKLFLKPGLGLGFDAAAGAAQTADYVSDPANPVAFVPRPVLPVGYDDDHWTAWLTTDQRKVSGRPDVLAFTSEVLTEAVTIAGQPVVHLTASTSGTDSDWVVKLIDVYPDQVPIDHAMGGYQLAVAMDIFRGRYRESFAQARPLKANAPLRYEFALPNSNHVFLPGHRIMVQIQSSWFPLYDRNPQTFVPNIFFAKPEDYVKATQKVTVAGPDESYIALPVVK